MNLYKMINGLKTKVMKPRVYAMVIWFTGSSHIALQAAYSLEEAFVQAKEEIHRKFPQVPLEDVKIGVFDNKSVDDLLAPYLEGQSTSVALEAARPQPTPHPVQILKSQDKPMPTPHPEAPTEPEFDKLDVMRKVVAKKDKALYEQHKGSFTENERSYLEDKLKA